MAAMLSLGGRPGAGSALPPTDQPHLPTADRLRRPRLRALPPVPGVARGPAALVPLHFVATDEETPGPAPQRAMARQQLSWSRQDGATWVGPAAFLTCLWAGDPPLPGLVAPVGRALVVRPHGRAVLHAGLVRTVGRIGAFLAPADCVDGACRHHIDPTLGTSPSPRANARGDASAPVAGRR